MVNILGKFGPVMLAHYKANNSNQAPSTRTCTRSSWTVSSPWPPAAGLFALSFMDGVNLAPASSFAFIASAVARYHPELLAVTRATRDLIVVGVSWSRSEPTTGNGPYPCARNHPHRSGTSGRKTTARTRRPAVVVIAAVETRRDPGTARWGTGGAVASARPATVGEWPVSRSAICGSPARGHGLRPPTGRRVGVAARLSIHTPISPAAKRGAEARPKRPPHPSSTHCADRRHTVGVDDEEHVTSRRREVGVIGHVQADVVAR